MQKVPRRKKFPFREEDYEIPETSPQIMAEKDYDKVRELVQSGDKEKLHDFINKRLTTNENFSERPGLATRNYMKALTGEAVKKRYPEIREAALQGTPADLGRAVRSKMFPRIEEALKTHNLSSEIEDSDENKVNTETGLMSLSGYDTPSGNIGTAIHENAHLLDTLAKKYSKAKYIAERGGRSIDPEKEKAVQDFLKYKPAAASSFKEDPEKDMKYLRQTTGGELINKYGNRIRNEEVPNFEDYDFEKGEFRSDMIRNPIDVQEESGRPHHLDRNQTYENMIKALEDEGELDRITMFKKLREKLA